MTAVNNLVEFFRDAFAKALAYQHVLLDEHTSHYVVSLLALYSRTEISHRDMRPGQRWVSLSGLPVIRLPRQPLPKESEASFCKDSKKNAAAAADAAKAASSGAWWTWITISRWADVPMARWPPRGSAVRAA